MRTKRSAALTNTPIRFYKHASKSLKTKGRARAASIPCGSMQAPLFRRSSRFDYR
jgi:hypothetical protein